MRRVKETVSMDLAKARLLEFKAKDGNERRLWPASFLAAVIWPDNTFRSGQGAGRAAAGVLKRVGIRYRSRVGEDRGYDLSDLR